LIYLPFHFFLHFSATHRDLHSFPTRRSSDLVRLPPSRRKLCAGGHCQARRGTAAHSVRSWRYWRDRRCGRINRCFLSAGEAGKRSEEHTSELQSRSDLVCRLLLEKKKTIPYL